MRLTAIIFVAAGIHLSAAGFAQTVTLSEKNAPLDKVFADIRQQTGYAFFFDQAWLARAGAVTLDLHEAPLITALDACFRDQPLTYSIVGKTVVVHLKEPDTSPSSRQDPSAQVASPPAGPIVEIKGRVTNDKGEPLANATVVVKRTGRGTVTDANGEFILHNLNSEDLVTVTFIGYKAQTMAVRDRSSLTVFMEPATDELDKTVVQAYGTTSQRLATGNIGVVRAEDIEKQPVMNVLQAVQGQVAGVVVTNVGGYASGTVKVEIRGRNTISPDFPSDPLYVIDGVPLTILDLQGSDNYANGSVGMIQSGVGSPAGGQSPFFSINPGDIESIEILKDADATAIYGSRGSNGVILISTKKGKAGKPHFDFNMTTGISNTPRYYHLLNTQQYIAMRKEALANDGLTADINNAPDLVAWDTTRYTDWQKFLWDHTGKFTNAEGSLSGGDTRTTYRVGGGYQYQTEILTRSGANQRGSVSINLVHKSLNQRFSLALSGSYSITSSDITSYTGVITLPPNAPPIFDKYGKLNFAGWAPLDYKFPFGSMLQPYNSKSNFLNGDLVLTYEILKGLQVRANLGYNNAQTNQATYSPIASQNPAYNPKGSSSFGYTFFHNLIIEPQLEYNRYLNKGKLNILAGLSDQRNSTSSAFLVGNGYTNDALLTSVVGAPSQYSGNFAGEYKYEGVFGRVNYNWEDKYIISLNGRRDGSSKFGPGRQFGNFSSIGATWIFTEENWLKQHNSVLSFGKIRGSYGTTGGDQIGNYDYLSQWSFGRSTYNNVLPLTPMGHTDSTLHWQVNRKLEAALDLAFLGDRITLEIAWYRNRCNDQLVSFPTPNFTGFSDVTSNSPANVENQGWEVIQTAKPISNEKFKWTEKILIGINRNKLLSYPNISQSPYANRFIIGQSLNIAKLLHYTGINPQTGTYSFEDKNHDGQITISSGATMTDDRYPVDLSPKFDGGFTNTFSYKNWELSIFFYFKEQKGINAIAALDAPGDNTNQPSSVLNRWQKPGDMTGTPRFTTNPYNGPNFIDYQYSDALYTDASFIRLQNLAISYSLPENIMKKAHMSNCKIYMKGENLFIITRYNGLDPEVQNFGVLPRARFLTAGISCNL